ncbi:DNase I-like protein [Obba rivulosa]|uniref:DNase I-like protein n=1 Tax=Obba rivulosa TaxID=1052685 RepID=A0A8E2J5U7_9APHY|nr:DNase I-like protein [Obba rivulosa]
MVTFVACVSLHHLGASAVSVADIQGASFQSPLVGQTVRDVTGVVTAKDRYGFWIAGEPSEDVRVSTGLRIYSSAAAHKVAIGDLISLDGRVAEYRAKNSPNDLTLTEIDLVHVVSVLSHNHDISPIVLGKDRTPPTGKLSSVDAGRDGWLSLPNNVTLLEEGNTTLQPDSYGLDFWESLEGQVVTIPNPMAVNFPDRFGSFWVHGDWFVTGKNERGGITLTFDKSGVPNAHPEAIFVGHPLDGTRNPKPFMGAALSNITGVVTYQFGFFYILPLTAPTIVSVPETSALPASARSSSAPCLITIGDYNVENMSPRSQHIPAIAKHITDFLHTPDMLFVQEIQDDSGVRNDGVVSANRTLAALAQAIKGASGVHYDFADVDPEDNMDGGQPGGNIRVAYLWRPEKVSLVAGHRRGSATQATEIVRDGKGELTLSLNPGRIDPTNIAWDETRKPIAAAWQTTSGERFFTVNVHFRSKRDSSSPQGNARPPVNGHSEERRLQMDVTANFVESILVKDANASVVVAGDFNEFVQTRSVFESLQGLLFEPDVNFVPPEERYTYVYDQHAQAIDHMFVSPAILARGAAIEHVHINTWAPTARSRASDHDPTVAQLWVCDSQEIDSVLPLEIDEQIML